VEGIGEAGGDEDAEGAEDSLLEEGSARRFANFLGSGFAALDLSAVGFVAADFVATGFVAIGFAVTGFFVPTSFVARFALVFSGAARFVAERFLIMWRSP
jgi:hypothetical protein